MFFKKLFSFFKAKETDSYNEPQSTTITPSNSQTSQATKQINYNPQLVNQLTADHKLLLDIAGKISKSYEAKKWTDLANNIQLFRSKLYGHLVTENVDLYLYLQRSLKSNPEGFTQMRELQREMSGISKAVTAFINKYADIDKSPAYREAFGAEFNAVCQVLLKRIQCEEKTLYPMYSPA